MGFETTKKQHTPQIKVQQRLIHFQGSCYYLNSLIMNVIPCNEKRKKKKKMSREKTLPSVSTTRTTCKSCGGFVDDGKETPKQK
jgi:hypothetical protein